MSPLPPLNQVSCDSWARGSDGSEKRTGGEDCLVVEEPLEFRIRGKPVATVMRTPGSDRELAIGFFFNEGFISSRAEVGSLALCASGDHPDIGNVANLIPPAGLLEDLQLTPRSVTMTSSCGVCGKRTISQILASVPQLRNGGDGREFRPHLDPGTLRGMPTTLRSAQALFSRTGALHAAGIFDPRGRLLRTYEDVGRHNTVDKVIGACVLSREIPLGDRVLLVSGRVSFEIVQKALRGRINTVAGISGVSSLARDLAVEGRITLIGFLREGSFKVYAHPGRIKGGA